MTLQKNTLQLIAVFAFSICLGCSFYANSAAAQIREYTIKAYGDYQWFQAYSSNVSASQSAISSAVAAASVITERDLGIKIKLVDTVIFTSNSQPFVATEPAQALRELKTYLVDTSQTNLADGFFLFSGKDLNGSAVAASEFSVVCKSDKTTAGIQHMQSSTSQNAFLLAQNLGRTLGAATDFSSSGIMSSGVPTVGEYSQNSQNQIASYLSSWGACLSVVSGVTPTATTTATRTATATATATSTVLGVQTATRTRTPTRTATASPTATATRTATVAGTPPTLNPTPTATITNTPTNTLTPGPTGTPTPVVPKLALRLRLSETGNVAGTLTGSGVIDPTCSYKVNASKVSNFKPQRTINLGLADEARVRISTTVASRVRKSPSVDGLVYVRGAYSCDDTVLTTSKPLKLDLNSIRSTTSISEEQWLREFNRKLTAAFRRLELRRLVVQSKHAAAK